MKFLQKNSIMVLLIAGIIFYSIVFAVDTTFAQIQQGTTGAQLEAAGAQIGLTDEDPRIFIASIIQFSLGILGTLFTGLLIYAGYNYFISRGGEEQINEAKKTLMRAVIGLILILLSYSITTLIKSSLAVLSG